MEMNFPHRAMRLAAHGNINDGGGLAARIQCFAAEPNPDIEVRVPFGKKRRRQK